MSGKDEGDTMKEGRIAKEILNAISQMRGEEFQSLCRELADRMEVQIDEIESAGGETRIRGELRPPGEEPVSLVMAFKKEKVEPEDLQRIVSMSKDAVGIFITPSEFSEDARTYGEEGEVKMFNSQGFVDLLRQYELTDYLEDRLRKRFLKKEGARFLPSIDRLEGLMKLANDHFEIGNHKKALGFVEQALDLKPNYDLAWSLRSRIFEALGEMDKALESAEKAAEYNISDPNLWLALGNLLSRMGRVKEEIECYERAIRLNKRFVQAWNNKGVALHSLGKYRDAIKSYDRVVELDPSHAQAYNNKGAALRRLGESKEALRLYERALELDPNLTDAWTNKAVLLQLIGDDTEAINAFNRALEDAKENARIWYQKGISHMNLQQDDEANKAFQEALGLDPTLIEAKRAQEKIEKGIRRKGYPCFGDYDGKDEGCKDCKVSTDCKEKSK